MTTETQLTDLQKERVDGAMLLGFGWHGERFHTYVEDDQNTQLLYKYIGPIVEERSMDSPRGEDYTIVSWKPIDAVQRRVEQWRNRVLTVPADVIISEATMEMLLRLNARMSRDEQDNVMVVELQTPPLDKSGAGIICETLSEYDIDAEGGVGSEHIRIDSDHNLDRFYGTVVPEVTDDDSK